MKRRALLLAVTAAAVAACSRNSPQTDAPGANAPATTPPAPDPADVVRAIYTPYLTRGAPFPDFRHQAPWSDDLWAQIEAMMARSEALNEPILDFDPVINAQDGEVSALQVATDGMVANSRAVVRANFTNFGHPEEILFDMIWENGGWRVNNVRNAEWDLRQIVTQGADPQSGNAGK